MVTVDDLHRIMGKIDSVRISDLLQSTLDFSRYGMLLAIPGGILVSYLVGLN